MTTETPELAWRCRRCGWQGETPDSAPVLNPATGDGYRAPCCPPCGQYFSQDDIDRAEAIRAGAANLPTAEIAPSPSPVVSEEMDPAFVRRVLAENGFLSTYSIQGQIDDAAMTVARALTASLSLAPAEAGWRTDIADAPRDGTPVRLLIETEAKWQQHLPMILQQGGWQRTAHSDKVLGWQPSPQEQERKDG